MLVLSRKKDEKIRLVDEVTGTTIFVSVLEINKSNVKLGLDAPDHVNIARNELGEKKGKSVLEEPGTKLSEKLS